MALLSLAGCLAQVWSYAEAKSVEPLHPALIFLASAVLIYLAAAQNGPVSAALGSVEGWIGSLGLATYPLYLIHYDIKALALYLFPEIERSVPLQIVLACAIVALSIAIAQSVEPRVRRPMRIALWRLRLQASSPP